MEKAEVPGGSSEERRESFRVEDVVPLTCQKIDPNQPHLGCRVVPGFTEDSFLPDSAAEPPDESVNPHLWRMLLQIHARLGLIIQKLNLEEEGTEKAEPKQISLSASGVRFSTPERYATGDLVEVKILLPLEPPSWIVVYGSIVRSAERGDGQRDVGVQFADMDEPVIETINRYCLKRQREMIRRRRES